MKAQDNLIEGGTVQAPSLITLTSKLTSLLLSLSKNVAGGTPVIATEADDDDVDVDEGITKVGEIAEMGRGSMPNKTPKLCSKQPSVEWDCIDITVDADG